MTRDNAGAINPLISNTSTECTLTRVRDATALLEHIRSSDLEEMGAAARMGVFWLYETIRATLEYEKQDMRSRHEAQPNETEPQVMVRGLAYSERKRNYERLPVSDGYRDKDVLSSA